MINFETRIKKKKKKNVCRSAHPNSQSERLLTS